MTTNLSPRFRRTERQVYRRVAGEHLLVDLHSKAREPFFALTPTAVPLWEALAEWQTVASLAARLCERYGIAAAQAERDVRDFLAELQEIGGVEQAESDA